MQTDDLSASVEEACLNAWPALKEIFYDGWLIRLAEGETRRTNSVNVMGAGRYAVADKIAYCEAVYRAHGQPTYFRIRSNDDPALDALLAANAVELPEALLREDVRQTTLRVAKNMRQQGLQPDRAMFDDPAFQKEVRDRAERGLKLSVLLQAVREQAKAEVTDDDIEAELDAQAQQYPEAQHEEFKRWMRGQPERMQELNEQLLEHKCIAYIVAKAKTKKQAKSLADWQSEQDQGQEK